MSTLERLVPPVPLEGDDGIVKPSRMQHQEQLATVLLGGVNAVACVAMLVVVPARETEPDKANLLRLFLGLGFVASIACLPAARRGNRLIAGIVLLAAGFLGPGTVNPFLVIPHYGVAMWMVLRQNRMVKEQAAARRKQRQELAAKGGPTRTAGGKGGRNAPKLPDGRLAPPPSKRYTPPRPKKKAAPKPRATDDA